MHHSQDEIKARLGDLRTLLAERRMSKPQIWIRLGCGSGIEAEYKDALIEYLIDADILTQFKTRWSSKFENGKELSTGFFSRLDGSATM